MHYICLFVCMYGVFTLHGTSGHSAMGPTALRDFQTMTRVNFYHQETNISDPSRIELAPPRWQANTKPTMPLTGLHYIWTRLLYK